MAPLTFFQQYLVEQLRRYQGLAKGQLPLGSPEHREVLRDGLLDFGVGSKRPLACHPHLLPLLDRVRAWAENEEGSVVGIAQEVASLVNSPHRGHQSAWDASDDPVVFLCWAAVNTEIAAELARGIYTLDPFLAREEQRALALRQLARMDDDG